VLANYKTETDMKASTENLNTLGEQPKQIETVSSQKKTIETVQNMHGKQSNFPQTCNCARNWATPFVLNYRHFDFSTYIVFSYITRHNVYLDT